MNLLSWNVVGLIKLFEVVKMWTSDSSTVVDF